MRVWKPIDLFFANTVLVCGSSSKAFTISIVLSVYFIKKWVALKIASNGNILKNKNLRNGMLHLIAIKGIKARRKLTITDNAILKMSNYKGLTVPKDNSPSTSLGKFRNTDEGLLFSEESLSTFVEPLACS